MEPMNRRRFLMSSGIGMPASLLAAQQKPPTATRPNIIGIFGGQHRAQALLCGVARSAAAQFLCRAPPEWMARHNPNRLELRPNVPNVRYVQERCRRELAGYSGMIENLDRNMGRIRQALDDAGMSFDTHILFFSDHGDMLGSHGQFLKMTPHEESIRIPFLIGGTRPPGMEIHRCAARTVSPIDAFY